MKELYQALCELPCDLDKLQHMLEEKHYPPEDLTQTVLRFVLDECRWEADDFQSSHGREPQDHELHCFYLFDVLKLALTFGLDPNGVRDDQTLMWAMLFLDYRFIAANCLRLLIEHGGDAQQKVDGESIFGFVDFEIVFMLADTDPERYEQLVHMWLVLIGCGCYPDNGTEPVHMLSGHQLSELKEHERFDYSIEYTKSVKEGWILHIFRKDTGEEVAVL